MQKKTYPIRTRFAKDIVAEIQLPKRATGKVAVFVGGLPGQPSRSELLAFLSKQGYVAVAPRLRGTWESGGTFLRGSPAKDVADVIYELKRKRGIHDLYTGQTVRFPVKHIHLFGVSFGGPAVLLNAAHPDVEKVVALAPVIDWSVDSQEEPFSLWTRFTNEGFGEAYRMKHFRDWQKLIASDFYSPIRKAENIPGRKIFIIQSKDDGIVPYEPLLEFAEKTGARYYLKPKGGHLGSRNLTQKFYWKKIESFLKKR